MRVDAITIQIRKKRSEEKKKKKKKERLNY